METTRARIDEFGCHAPQVERLMKDLGVLIVEPVPEPVLIKHPGTLVRFKVPGIAKLRTGIVTPYQGERCTGKTAVWVPFFNGGGGFIMEAVDALDFATLGEAHTAWKDLFRGPYA